MLFLPCKYGFTSKGGSDLWHTLLGNKKDLHAFFAYFLPLVEKIYHFVAGTLRTFFESLP